MDNVVSGIIGAVIGALITSVVSWIINKQNLAHADKIEREKLLREEYEKRPRLELKSFKSLSEGDIDSPSDCECLLLKIEGITKKDDRLCFSFDDHSLDTGNLSCVEYVFTNTGKTEISDICLICNQQEDTSIFPLKYRAEYLATKMINYEVWSDKRSIKPGDTTTIKICYIKNKVDDSLLGSAMIGIYMLDINGNYWHQPLFCPNNETDNSNRVSFTDFKHYRDTDLAIKCFLGKEPW